MCPKSPNFDSLLRPKEYLRERLFLKYKIEEQETGIIIKS